MTEKNTTPAGRSRPQDSDVARIASASGLSFLMNQNGSVRRIDRADIVVNLFIGNEFDGGPANLWLRRRGADGASTPLLGPRSPSRFDLIDGRWTGRGEWHGLRYVLSLRLAEQEAAWFWHVALLNTSDAPVEVELIHAQDIGLAPYGAIRLNEFYVSQYIDHTVLAHAQVGQVIASRQNQAAGGRIPWSVIGSLREARGYATDALQVLGLSGRSGAASPIGQGADLPGARLQHEHSMAALQDAPLSLAPGERASAGFFGQVLADHPAATSAGDLALVDALLALPEASPLDPGDLAPPAVPADAANLFSHAPLLATIDVDEPTLASWFGAERQLEERDAEGRLLSFFDGAGGHVVLRAKELAVLRPHGHLLRSGSAALPDESALTSTVWMSGVFHSMLTQGHVSINRLLSTAHSYIGLFRSHGQRVFVQIDDAWQLLDQPSAFEIQPAACRWLYAHAGGLIEVRAEAKSDPHAMNLRINVLAGAPLRCLISHHVAMNGDDGSAPGSALWALDGNAVAIAAIKASDVGRRFPKGSFRIVPVADTRFDKVGGDELLFSDGQSRQQPFVCIVTPPATSVELSVTGHLIADGPDVPDAQTRQRATLPALHITPPAGGPLAAPMAQLAAIVPWFTHNALIHFLSPRGLEQYSGGGWGTRDVSQGPLEMLLAYDSTVPIRDLLLRVMCAQNSSGDWPQWFMFFQRDRAIRADDSHGDIVFWPILALAQYLIATGDASILDEPVPFFKQKLATRPGKTTLWQHVTRALSLIRQRMIAGTQLVAYGHGDWNDALQPVDPAMREHLCSAWTVTLHHQTLGTLARALRLIGRPRDALRFEKQRTRVHRDFQRVLLKDGVLAGYALFDPAQPAAAPRLLLHPGDDSSGVHYSVLAMIHAILEDMLTPEQTRAHLALIETHLTGPDGTRLFDKPMPYRGGPQTLFQRAESATFFGREIGLMYMHAHLRHAQALAHVGEAEAFFRALCQANPIGIRAIVPTATLRQSNCYYSSSDAQFADRYEAGEEYGRIAAGDIALDGGWRVYSSGAGIALSLIVRRLLGLDVEAEVVNLDPVMPAALDGLKVAATLGGRALQVTYAVQGRGCGVTAVLLNGAHVVFERGANPHRPGAARVAKSALLEASSSQQPAHLEIRLG